MTTSQEINEHFERRGRRDAPLPANVAERRPRAVTIGRPRAEVYLMWRQFTNFRPFMENIYSVHELEDVVLRTGGDARSAAQATREIDDRMVEPRLAPFAPGALAALEAPLHPRELDPARERREERDAQHQHQTEQESPAHRVPPPRS